MSSIYDLPDNPANDLDYHIELQERLLGYTPQQTEPSDDWNYLEHLKTGEHLSGYTYEEFKECLEEVKQRKADMERIERIVERTRQTFSHPIYKIKGYN